MVSYNSSHSHGNNRQEPNSQKQHHHLLSVNKPPSKPSKKPPSATPGSGSTQPRVYNVKPIHFRELVQRLTGATSQAQAQAQPQPPSQRLQSAAPPPIQLGSHLNAWATPVHESYTHNIQKTEPSSVALPQDPTPGKYQKKSTAAGLGFSDGFLMGDGMELSLSPTTCSWFSFPLLSPGPLSNFGA